MSCGSAGAVDNILKLVLYIWFCCAIIFQQGTSDDLLKRSVKVKENSKMLKDSQEEVKDNEEEEKMFSYKDNKSQPNEIKQPTQEFNLKVKTGKVVRARNKTERTNFKPKKNVKTMDKKELTKENLELKAKVFRLESELELSTKKLKIYTKDLSKNNAKLEEHKKELGNKLKTSEENLEKLNRELKKKAEDFARLEDDYKKQLMEKTEEYSRLESTSNNLLSEFENVFAKVTKLKRENQKLRKKNNESSQSIELLLMQMEDLKSTLSKEDMNLQVFESKHEVEELQMQLEDMSSLFLAHKKICENLTIENEKLNTEIKVRDVLMEEHCIQNDSYEDESNCSVDAYSTENGEYMETDINKHPSEIVERLQSKIRELEFIDRQTVNLLTEKNIEVESQKVQLGVLNETMEKNKADNFQLSQKLKEQSQHLLKLQENVLIHQSHLVTRNEQVESLNMSMEEIRERSMIDTTRKSECLQHLQEDIKTQKVSLEKRNEKIELLNMTLEEIRERSLKESEKQRTYILKLRENTEAQRAHINSRNEEIEALKMSLEEIRAKDIIEIEKVQMSREEYIERTKLKNEEQLERLNKAVIELEGKSNCVNLLYVQSVEQSEKLQTRNSYLSSKIFKLENSLIVTRQTIEGLGMTLEDKKQNEIPKTQEEVESSRIERENLAMAREELTMRLNIIYIDYLRKKSLNQKQNDLIQMLEKELAEKEQERMDEDQKQKESIALLEKRIAEQLIEKEKQNESIALLERELAEKEQEHIIENEKQNSSIALLEKQLTDELKEKEMQNDSIKSLEKKIEEQEKEQLVATHTQNASIASLEKQLAEKEQKQIIEKQKQKDSIQLLEKQLAEKEHERVIENQRYSDSIELLERKLAEAEDNVGINMPTVEGIKVMDLVDFLEDDPRTRPRRDTHSTYLSHIPGKVLPHWAEQAECLHMMIEDYNGKLFDKDSLLAIKEEDLMTMGDCMYKLEKKISKIQKEKKSKKSKQMRKLERLYMMVEDLRTNIHCNDSQLLIHTAEMSSKDKMLSDLELENQALADENQELTEFMDVNQKLSSRNESLWSNNEVLCKANNVLEEKNNKLEHSNVLLRNEISDMAKQLQALKEESDFMKNNKDEIKQEVFHVKVKPDEAYSETLRDENKRLKEYIALMLKDFDENKERLEITNMILEDKNKKDQDSCITDTKEKEKNKEEALLMTIEDFRMRSYVARLLTQDLLNSNQVEEKTQDHNEQFRIFTFLVIEALFKTLKYGNNFMKCIVKSVNKKTKSFSKSQKDISEKTRPFSISLEDALIHNEHDDYDSDSSAESGDGMKLGIQVFEEKQVDYEEKIESLINSETENATEISLVEVQESLNIFRKESGVLTPENSHLQGITKSATAEIQDQINMLYSLHQNLKGYHSSVKNAMKMKDKGQKHSEKLVKQIRKKYTNASTKLLELANSNSRLASKNSELSQEISKLKTSSNTDERSLVEELRNVNFKLSRKNSSLIKHLAENTTEQKELAELRILNSQLEQAKRSLKCKSKERIKTLQAKMETCLMDLEYEVDEIALFYLKDNKKLEKMFKDDIKANLESRVMGTTKESIENEAGTEMLVINNRNIFEPIIQCSRKSFTKIEEGELAFSKEQKRMKTQLFLTSKVETLSVTTDNILQPEMNINEENHKSNEDEESIKTNKSYQNTSTHGIEQISLDSVSESSNGSEQMSLDSVSESSRSSTHTSAVSITEGKTSDILYDQIPASVGDAAKEEPEECLTANHTVLEQESTTCLLPSERELQKIDETGKEICSVHSESEVESDRNSSPGGDWTNFFSDY